MEMNEAALRKVSEHERFLVGPEFATFPEQGYWGEGVKRNGMESIIGDWATAYGPGVANHLTISFGPTGTTGCYSQRSADQFELTCQKFTRSNMQVEICTEFLPLWHFESLFRMQWQEFPYSVMELHQVCKMNVNWFCNWNQHSSNLNECLRCAREVLQGCVVNVFFVCLRFESFFFLPMCFMNSCSTTYINCATHFQSNLCPLRGRMCLSLVKPVMTHPSAANSFLFSDCKAWIILLLPYGVCTNFVHIHSRHEFHHPHIVSQCFDNVGKIWDVLEFGLALGSIWTSPFPNCVHS